MNIQHMIDWSGSNVGAILLRWTLLLGLAWVAHGLLRSRDARWRLILWRGVLCAGLLLPVLQFIPVPRMEIPLPERHAVPVVVALPSLQSTPSPNAIQTVGSVPPEVPSVQPRPVVARFVHREFPWLLCLEWFWAVGSVIGAIRLFYSMAQLARIRKRAVAASPDLIAQSLVILSRHGCQGPLPILISKETETPFICGIAKPAILIPEKLANTLTLTELTTLLEHEIAHLRRHDVFWCVAWRWMQAAFWFHPLVWKIPAVHSFACEEEADRAAADHIGSQAAYTEMLAGLTLHILKVPAVETQLTANGAAEITCRLRRLGCHLRSWKRRHAAAAVTMVAFIIALSTGCKLVPQQTELPNPPAGFKTIEITVFDSKGIPLKGASVLCNYVIANGLHDTPQGTPSPIVKHLDAKPVVTSAEGKAVVTYPVDVEPGSPTKYIRYSVSHPDFLPCSQSATVTELSTSARMTQWDVEIRGHFSKDRKPVRELEGVVYDYYGSDILPAERGFSFRNNSRNFGTMQIPPGKHFLQAAGKTTSGLFVFSECVEFTAESNKLVKLDLPMNVGIRVEGRIDENVPRPVKNGLVFISVRPKQYNQIDWRPKSIPSNRSDYDMFPLYTDCQSLSEEGTFKFENLPPGILDVIVLGDGFVWKNQSTNETGNVPQSFDLQRPTTQVVIATEPSKTVELVVRDQRGKPAAGIPIDFEIWAKFIGSIQQQPSVIYTYSQPNQKYYLEKYRLTDKEGRVVFNNLPTFVHGFYQFQDGASPKYLVTPSPDPLKTGVTNNFKVRLYE